MGWITMTLRKTELQQSTCDRELKLMQISHQLRRLTSFSSAVADGKINPSEIASIGTDLFGDALDFMGYGSDAAAEIAQEQTDYYANMYEGVTQEQYFNNPSISSEAQLYYDEDGNLDTNKLYDKFYEEALKEYAEQYIMPLLNEKEKELETMKTEEETLLENERAELQSLSQSVSSEIQNNTIKLA